MAVTMLEIEKEIYRKYVIHVKNGKNMYVRLSKSMYGTLKAALL